ncbi:MAG: histidinol-phosphate transaminase [Anaerolineales bacterium]|nr:histidinol-phosphate transaminase [Anaerolineales bacterium]
MSSIEEFIVPWVRDSQAYNADHSDFAWNNLHLTRLMSNENPFPPSERVIQAIVEAAHLGNLYPGTGPELRTRLGAMVGLGPENIVIGNGSTDIVNIVLETFVPPEHEVIIPTPTFSMYGTRARIKGGVPVQIPMTKDFYWDIAAISEAVSPRTRLIFICSPNNPTGNQIAVEDLLSILDLGLPTFLDEAYFELEESPLSRVELITSYPWLMVNRTFSKSFGLAGFRIGYLICEQTLANYINRVRLPWNVSQLAIAAALAALDDQETQELHRAQILKERQNLFHGINKIQSLRALPTEGNFLLIDARGLGLTSEEIVSAMLKKGVVIRSMASSQAMEGFVRVTVGTEEQNREFLQALRELAEETILVGR